MLCHHIGPVFVPRAKADEKVYLPDGHSRALSQSEEWPGWHEPMVRHLHLLEDLDRNDVEARPSIDESTIDDDVLNCWRAHDGNRATALVEIGWSSLIRLKRIYNFLCLICLQHIHNFWCSMLVFYTICLVFRYTSWHFYAFSGTNLLTSRHNASSLFFAVFVFQKSYIGNIFGIGQNQSQSPRISPKLPENWRGDGVGPRGPHTPGRRGQGLGCAPYVWDLLGPLLTMPLRL
jgi:hypothetical protein